MMRKTLTTAALLLALSCPTLAGIIHTPGSPEPTPTPTSATQEPTDGPTLDSEIATPGVSDSLTETALGLLAVLPALF